MNNGKLLLASAFIVGTVLIAVPVLKENYSSRYEPLTELSSENGKAADATGTAQWWFNLQKDENGQINIERMMQVRDEVMAQRKLKKRTTASTWSLNFQELGPDNVGGRTRAICFDRMNHSHMFAGGVSGGLWESNDGGSSWHHQKAWDQFDVLTITTIAQSADNTWYFGTGEGIYYYTYGSGTGGFIGGGVWHSTNNGGSWSRLTSTTAVVYTSTGNRWSSVSKIATDPTDANRIYVGTMQGLMVSTDAGTTFTVSATTMTQNVLDVDVASDHSVYAVVGSRVYRSSTGTVGAGWSFLANGLPVSGIGRLEVAISPQDPNYVYVVAGSSASKLYGVYLSTDAASGTPHFTQIAGAGNAVFEPFGSNGQAGYDMTLAVDPFDKNHIVLGGVSLWRWDMTNGNPAAPVGQWTNIASQFGSAADPTYVHTDNHMILFDDMAQNRFFIGCDGGIYRTLDNGLTYIPCNKNYRVTQYYDVACDYSDPTRTINIGGCQDNGSQFIDGLGATPMSATSVGGGDGGGVAFSFLNPNAGFATVYYGSLYRSANRGSGGGGADFYNNRMHNIGKFLSPAQSIGQAGFANFVTPIKLWEGLNDPNSQDSLLFAAQRQTGSIFAGDDSTVILNKILKVNFNGQDQPNGTIIPGSLVVTNGTMTFTDNGAGVMTGAGLKPGLLNNTINYGSRALKLTFDTTIFKGTVVKVGFEVYYNQGVQLNMASKTNHQQFSAICPSTLTSLGPNDSAYVKDIIQAKLAVGFTAQNGLFVTNKPLDFAGSPLWVKVAGVHSLPSAFASGLVQDMAWSDNGNTLFFSTDVGELFRVDGISFLRDTLHDDIDFGPSSTTNPSGAVNPRTHLICTKIGSTGNAQTPITSIDVDPHNPDNLLIAVAGYTSGVHIYRCATATTAPATTNMSNFTSCQGTGLPTMPVYACSYDKYNANHVLIGTDYGIYSTDNVTASPVTWTSQADTLSTFPHVPTLKIHQSRFEPWNNCFNSGVFYIATHGRGTWKSEVSYQGMNTGIVNNPDMQHAAPSIRIFPNPMSETGHVSFNLNKPGDVKVHIFSLQGQLVKDMVIPHLMDGLNTIEFDCSTFSAGTYILSFESGVQHSASRFIVTK
jgi:hypothetical protein